MITVDDSVGGVDLKYKDMPVLGWTLGPLHVPLGTQLSPEDTVEWVVTRKDDTVIYLSYTLDEPPPIDINARVATLVLPSQHRVGVFAHMSEGTDEPPPTLVDRPQPRLVLGVRRTNGNWTTRPLAVPEGTVLAGDGTDEWELVRAIVEHQRVLARIVFRYQYAPPEVEELHVELPCGHRVALELCRIDPRDPAEDEMYSGDGDPKLTILKLPAVLHNPKNREKIMPLLLRGILQPFDEWLAPDSAQDMQSVYDTLTEYNKMLVDLQCGGPVYAESRLKTLSLCEDITFDPEEDEECAMNEQDHLWSDPTDARPNLFLDIGSTQTVEDAITIAYALGQYVEEYANAQQ